MSPPLDGWEEQILEANTKISMRETEELSRPMILIKIIMNFSKGMNLTLTMTLSLTTDCKINLVLTLIGLMLEHWRDLELMTYFLMQKQSLMDPVRGTQMITQVSRYCKEHYNHFRYNYTFFIR